MIIYENKKIILEDREIEFDEKILEVAKWENNLLVVFETSRDNGYDNVYCYTKEKEILWRIKKVPIEIGGTARTTYVGIEVIGNVCKVVDFYGRRFTVNICNGEILSKEIVK